MATRQFNGEINKLSLSPVVANPAGLNITTVNILLANSTFELPASTDQFDENVAANWNGLSQNVNKTFDTLYPLGTRRAFGFTQGMELNLNGNDLLSKTNAKLTQRDTRLVNLGDAVGAYTSSDSLSNINGFVPVSSLPGYFTPSGTTGATGTTPTDTVVGNIEAAGPVAGNLENNVSYNNWSGLNEGNYKNLQPVGFSRSMEFSNNINLGNTNKNMSEAGVQPTPDEQNVLDADIKTGIPDNQELSTYLTGFVPVTSLPSYTTPVTFTGNILLDSNGNPILDSSNKPITTSV